MDSILKNWKTTASGVALLALAVLHAFGVSIPGVPMPDLSPTTIATVFGLIVAADGDGGGAVAKAKAVFTPDNLSKLMQAADVIVSAAAQQKKG